MQINDKMGLEGTLNIYLDYTNGHREKVFSEQNLITNNGRMAILHALGNTTTSDPITRLHAGVGGTSDSKGLYPYVENPAATGLVAEVVNVLTSNVEDPIKLTITFLADILTTQANGSLITEAGLFKASGLMFNLKNHPGIFKSSAFSIHYEWVIST